MFVFLFCFVLVSAQVYRRLGAFQQIRFRELRDKIPAV